MPDLMLEQPVENSQKNLRRHFLVAGTIAVLVLACLAAVAHYWLARSATIESVSTVMVEHISSEFKQLEQGAEGLTISASQQDLLARERIQSSAKTLIDRLMNLYKLDSLVVFSRSQELVWNSESAPESIPLNEKALAVSLLSLESEFRVQDQDFTKLSTWRAVLFGEANEVVIWIGLGSDQGTTDYLLRTVADFSTSLVQARGLAIRTCVMLLVGCLILFFVLSLSFRRGVNTIKAQEQKMSHQIQRLSNLLSVNKAMQNSMKTASARAVELNEQFLRRVGADLHDGPAQMIGYSVLRLNEVSRKEQAQSLGQEFHAVKEALEESLTEIRGISSGLVLPELAELNFEECLRKVVTLHGTKSKAEVAQYYSELPEDIPLPIKITAYRFIQEGLNNAEDHGQATKCRLSAHVVDNKLTVSLKDNGIGFRKSKLSTAADGGHLGIVGLRDRIESLGGKLSINSELGVGTALKFTISVADET